MAVRYLLDTNTASYVIKGNFPRVREQLVAVPMAEVGISVITEAELLFGLARLPQAVSLRVAVEPLMLSPSGLCWSLATESSVELQVSRSRTGANPPETSGRPDERKRPSLHNQFAKSRQLALRAHG